MLYEGLFDIRAKRGIIKYRIYFVNLVCLILKIFFEKRLNLIKRLKKLNFVKIEYL